MPDWPAIRAALPREVEVTEGLGAVSVVGAAVGKSPFVIGQLIAGARAHGVELCSVITSPLRATLVCREKDVDRLVACAHAIVRDEAASA